MSRFDLMLRAIFRNIIKLCDDENYFRANNMYEKIHDCTAKIIILSNILRKANIYVTFEYDPKLFYLKVFFKDMIENEMYSYDILSAKKQLGAMYGKSALSGIVETDDGYEL